MIIKNIFQKDFAFLLNNWIWIRLFIFRDKCHIFMTLFATQSPCQRSLWNPGFTMYLSVISNAFFQEPEIYCISLDTRAPFIIQPSIARWQHWNSGIYYAIPGLLSWLPKIIMKWQTDKKLKENLKENCKKIEWYFYLLHFSSFLR